MSMILYLKHRLVWLSRSGWVRFAPDVHAGALRLLVMAPFLSVRLLVRIRNLGHTCTNIICYHSLS